MSKMTYWVREDGTILRAEKDISEETANLDPVFALPFQQAAIIGLNLFSFIEGMEVRHLYSMLHRRVLRDAQEMSFDYRCDSASIRRDMRMSLGPDRGLVRYESVVLRETPRAVPTPEASSDAMVFVPICSTCCRYRYPRESAEWKEIDLFHSEPNMPEQFNFTHTLCEDCHSRIMAVHDSVQDSGNRSREATRHE